MASNGIKDRVAIVGSWIWDCGHWTGGGERTEIHPFQALWVERNGGAPSPASSTGESEGDLFLSRNQRILADFPQILIQRSLVK